jgi:hypothetical protein
MSRGARKKKLKKACKCRFTTLGLTTGGHSIFGHALRKISSFSTRLNPKHKKCQAAVITAVESPIRGLLIAGGAAPRLLLFFFLEMSKFWVSKTSEFSIFSGEIVFVQPRAFSKTAASGLKSRPVVVPNYPRRTSVV